MQLHWLGRQVAGKGLKNIGRNACFMNAMVQMLAHTPAIGQFFQAGHHGCAAVFDHRLTPFRPRMTDGWQGQLCMSGAWHQRAKHVLTAASEVPTIAACHAGTIALRSTIASLASWRSWSAIFCLHPGSPARRWTRWSCFCTLRSRSPNLMGASCAGSRCEVLGVSSCLLAGSCIAEERNARHQGALCMEGVHFRCPIMRGLFDRTWLSRASALIQLVSAMTAAG